jgi:NAD(P)H-dependent flavin oxidoreductase YrpB (nitropropane dioxygenase family)
VATRPRAAGCSTSRAASTGRRPGPCARDDPEARARDSVEQRRYGAARDAGDFTTAGILAGEAADLVRAVEPAGDIVRRIVLGAEALLANASLRIT